MTQQFKTPRKPAVRSGALLTYTTEVNAAKTAAEMMTLLGLHGAREVMMKYDDAGQVTGLAFVILTPDGNRLAFRVPVNADAVYKVMDKQSGQGKLPYRLVTRDQARRVAWRIALRWLEAQLAVVEAETVSLDQVMLPYWIAPNGKMFYEALKEQHFMLRDKNPVEVVEEEHGVQS